MPVIEARFESVSAPCGAPKSSAASAARRSEMAVVLPEPAILVKALKNARLFQVKGRSAEPIALEGQFLITQQIPFGVDAIAEVEGRLVIAVDENGARYFKRLRRHAEIIVLESLNPDGTTPAELLSLDGSQGLPKLTGMLTVVGVLFELP